ncbi:MAG: hypothetical protein AAFY48_15960, partial [Bacteroidota bacterium]
MNNIPKKVEQLIELWLEDPGAFSLADAAGYEGYGDYLSAFQHGYYMGQPEPASEPPEDMNDKLMRIAEQGLSMMMNQSHADSFENIVDLTDKIAFQLLKKSLMSAVENPSHEKWDPTVLGYQNYQRAIKI